MEQLDYNILYRWFVGLNLDDPVWLPRVFTKNRERLLRGNIANAFLAEVLREAERRAWLSNQHFTVDGTLLEAWASHKSFQRKDGSSSGSDDNGRGNPTMDFRAEKRSNATHESVTDPECRLAKKSAGKEARFSYQGSVVIDNRHGLAVATHVTQPGYDAECRSALEMMPSLPPTVRQRTLGGDKGYDREVFVAGVRSLGVTPHVARNVHRTSPQSAIDGRTTRHAGYAVSQRKRKVVEEAFGWGKVGKPLGGRNHCPKAQFQQPPRLS